MNKNTEKNTVLKLATDLINRPSLTPHDEGCQDLIAQELGQAGFTIQHLPFGEGALRVNNLWATHNPNSNSTEPVLCFIGHTDVVPAGDLSKWDSPPFEATLKNNYLYGRGAADMKGSLASMIVAAQTFVKNHPNHSGTLAFLITSDEEGVALNGTRQVVEHFKKIGQKITWAIVGEPSSVAELGDTLKHGRRGSLAGDLTIHGKQGHIAYPQLANNPIPLALPALSELGDIIWDQESADFPATRFQISNIHAGTGADNVIPGEMQVLFNLRFSPSVSPEDIQHKIEGVLSKHKLNYTLNWRLSGLPFLTDKNAALVREVVNAVEEVTGILPALSTAGGTSDGRFVATLGTDVIELGPVNATIHQINECVNINDLDKLSVIYQRALEKLLK